jgi:protein-S-isoprenylcysteine O-methyltransferase Ste14
VLWRCAPLLLIALWTALVRWRARWQRRRFGVQGVHFLGAGSVADRWRARAGAAVFLFLAALAALAALGRLEVSDSAAARAAGLALSLAGSALMLVAQLQLGASWRIGIDPEARPGLVTHGLYAWVRNPIFSAVLLAWTGIGVLLAHPLAWAAIAAMALGVRLQVAREERWLAQAYGAAWGAYAARVGRFTPWTGRLHAP